MNRDAFSECHPLTCFAYFLAVICFSAVVRHPAYLAAGFAGALAYSLVLRGTAGLKQMLRLIPLLLLVAAANPLLNPRGRTVLFYVFGRPYTLEALAYGAVLAGMLGVMLLWFGCYSAVLTGDKIVCLFAPLAPALSLVLVMTMRLIPAFRSKSIRLAGARRCIGFGVEEQENWRGKLRAGVGIVSALTDWALEGSITTADSMRARGYGTGRRTFFRLYRMTARDGVLLGLIFGLAAATVFLGRMGAEFLPVISVDDPGIGLGTYCLLLALPVLLQGKEALQWRFCMWKI